MSQYLKHNPGSWDKIEHIVVLMLENRGFDHFMGYLYEGGTRPKNKYPPTPVGKHVGLREFEGMEGLSPTFPYDYDYTTKRRPRSDLKHNIKGEIGHKRGARACNIPRTNPHEAKRA